MKKTLFFLAVIGACLFFLPRYTDIITTKFYSDDFGVGFMHSSNFLLTEMLGTDTIELRKSVNSENQAYIAIEKYTKIKSDRLSFRITQEFGVPMLNETTEFGAEQDGVLFNWEGVNGNELAFGFEGRNHDYVLTTYGLSQVVSDPMIEKQFYKILKSLYLAQF